MSGLTTHVLDTTHGCPGAGIAVRLFACGPVGQDDTLIVETRTNDDGRCDQPLMSAEAMHPGRYRLEFDVADYFRRRGVDLPEPAFLDVVSIAFGIADAAAHYHVPLLVSPFGYSTYRGS